MPFDATGRTSAGAAHQGRPRAIRHLPNSLHPCQEELMKRQPRTVGRAFALLVATFLTASAPTTAFAQAKEVITFAAVTFSEAGCGDRLKALGDKFNKSQNAIEV